MLLRQASTWRWHRPLLRRIVCLGGRIRIILPALGADQDFDHFCSLWTANSIIGVENDDAFFRAAGIDGGSVGEVDGEDGSAPLDGGMADVGIEMIQDADFTDDSFEAHVIASDCYRAGDACEGLGSGDSGSGCELDGEDFPDAAIGVAFETAEGDLN